MTEEARQFNLLCSEIQAEIEINPKDRNNEHARETLEQFLQCKRSRDEHDQWRECYMLSEMLEIIKRRYQELNPHRARQTRIESGIASWEDNYQYTQEIDDTGMSQEEADRKQATLYPALNIPQLEQLAAECYLVNKLGADPRQALPRSQTHSEETRDQLATNPNPIISFRQLQKELKKDHFSPGTIGKAIERSINSNFEKKARPWAIGGCVHEYEIVDYDIRSNKGIPTPAHCKYQKKRQSEAE
jgi:hypothetical protein